MNPCFAIIDRSSLSSMALRSILWDIFDNVEVFTYNSMDSFIRDSNRHFVHFFVSGDILFAHIDEFETLKRQTIVLSSGNGQRFIDNGFHVIDTSLPEAEVVGQLLQLRQAGHYEQRISEQDSQAGAYRRQLSPPPPVRLPVAGQGMRDHRERIPHHLAIYLRYLLKNRQISSQVSMSASAQLCLPPTTSYSRTSISGPPFQAGSPPQ